MQHRGDIIYGSQIAQKNTPESVSSFTIQDKYCIFYPTTFTGEIWPLVTQ